jgi:hypothetical protein
MADLVASANAAPPAPESPPYDRFAWRFAFRKLVGDGDGKPLAALLRGAPAVEWYQQIPLEVCSALVELLDPRSPWNPFARPKLPPPDMMRTVDGEPVRLKTSIELERARESAVIERRRLVEEARKRGDKPGEDAASLKALAGERDDKTALAASPVSAATFRA